MEPPSGANSWRRSIDRRTNAARAWWHARRRRERLALAASTGVILVALPVIAILAGARPGAQPSPAGPAVVTPTSSLLVPSATASSIAPGASIAPTPAAPPPVSAAWALPAGWRHHLACNVNGRRCSLHLYDDADREQEGWPVAIAGECFYDTTVAVGPENTAFLACVRNGRVIISGLSGSGEMLAGWPVEVAGDSALSGWNDFQGSGSFVSSIAVGPDRTVFVSTATRGRRFAIHALALDGTPRRGWPVQLAGAAQGFRLAPDGTVVAWWYENALEEITLDARRTVFTMIDARGRTLPGWPRGSAGAASGPVVWRDGSIYYVSASGKVWGHDRTGEVIRGWPYALPEPIAPAFRADGSLIFFADSRVIVLDRRGRDAPGWPYRATGSLMGPNCDTPGWPSPVVATKSDGTLLLATWDGANGSIVALAPDGRTMTGWPYAVPTGWRVLSLDVAGDDSVTASLTADPCGGGFDATSVRLSRDGTLIGNPPASPLNVVYQALRLDALRTTDGRTAYPQGSGLAFDYRLVNRSSAPVVLPRVDYVGEPFYAAGFSQAWLERLGTGSEIGCMPDTGRKASWYPIGGQPSVSTDPVTIAPGSPMPSLFAVSLEPQITACLPPGDYRIHVEYLPLSIEPQFEDPLDETSVDFRILAGPTPAETPTPRPTPTPSPSPSPRPSAGT